MSPADRPIPCPLPFDELAPPPPPPAPPPSVSRVVTAMASGREEIAVIYKRTYTFEPDQSCKPTDEQPPLNDQHVPYDPPAADGLTSYKTLSEIVGYKTGTDVVVIGSARPPRPVAQMQVGVQVARKYSHRADVFGTRHCELVNGKATFTPPATFEEMPLRYENAYGGRDRRFEAALLERLKVTTKPGSLRRVTPAVEDIVSQGHPAMYPRNRFGKGYVIDGRPELVEGRELPNLERPDDRLTPARLVVGNPLDWAKQPLPVGFGCLEPGAFPRCSMVGLPPAVTEATKTFAEVARGYVPADFSRGNIFTTKPEDLPKLIHPLCGRGASLGLWLPFLESREVIALEGMDPAHPTLTFELPGETPEFLLSGVEREPVEAAGELYLVRVDVDRRRVTLLWTARVPSPAGGLTPQRLAAVEAGLRMRMRED